MSFISSGRVARPQRLPGGHIPWTKSRIRTTLVGFLRVQKEADRRRKSEAIRRKLVRLAAYRRATTVACYVSLPYEVETHQLIQDMLMTGKRVAVPYVRGRQLTWCELRDPAHDLRPGAFGVLEPRPSIRRVVRTEELDVIVVPGVAFDRHGHRLGHGHGYFDRFLDTLPADIPIIGLCFDFQLVATLPHEPHDHPVDAVLTN